MSLFGLKLYCRAGLVLAVHYDPVLTFVICQTSPYKVAVTQSTICSIIHRD